MKVLKKIAIGCGGLLLLAILAFACLYFLIQSKKEKYDALTEPYFAEFIPKLSTWDPTQTTSYWAPEVFEGIDSKRLQQLFAVYGQLGDLQYYDEPQFQQVSVSTQNPYPSSIHYIVHASYQNGEAELRFHLVSTEDGGLKIWGLKINSNAFLPNIESPQALPPPEA